MKKTVKYLAIYRHRAKYSIKVMCQFFSVSRSGYYSFINRMDKPNKDEPLRQMIITCQEHARKTYGYRRVKIWLEKVKCLIINHKRVLRIMNQYGLLSEIRRSKKYKRMGEHLHKYSNLLNRDFHAETINQKWVTDISYIHTGQGIIYLSIIRDLFDGSIVAYKMSTTQTVNLVLDTIKEAKQKERVTPELQLHSDQGFQYTSTGYFNLTKEYGITPSMSRRGNCYDNAMAENFFGILKSECIHRHRINIFDEARQLIDEYIYFYNFERIQLKTRLTPYEKRCQPA